MKLWRSKNYGMMAEILRYGFGFQAMETTRSVLIAFDKFKGSFSAEEACQAAERGVRQRWSSAETTCCPIADGGEGTAEALLAVFGGKWVRVEVDDPLGRKVEAKYALTDSGVAVLEMSEASGLWRCEPDERDPERASTYGTGQMVRHALEVSKATSVLIGIGGSATNDGGTGFARAIGVRFLDGTGAELVDLPRDISKIQTIDITESLVIPGLVVACDVTNPLLGNEGATQVFGPQKGVVDLEYHEGRLKDLADVVENHLGEQLRDMPGAGAAGGLGFGLMVFAGGKLKPGFDIVAEALDLESKIAAADLVLTGEGSLDSQTASGKGPAGVGLLAKKAGVPVHAFAGRVADREIVEPFFDSATAIKPEGWTVEQSMEAGSALLEKAVSEAEPLV